MLDRMRWTFLLFLAVAAPAQAADVAFMPINHQRIVPSATAGDVWRRMHDFLQDQGYAVTREDLVAGTIDAQRSIQGQGSFRGLAQCPSKLFWHPQREVTNLTVLIKPATEGVKVTANAAFVQAEPTKKKGALSLSCTSTGVLERAVLDVAAGQPMESAVVPQ
jgi:hypothetical protein